jgi:hypothetical protein
MSVRGSTISAICSRCSELHAPVLCCAVFPAISQHLACIGYRFTAAALDTLATENGEICRLADADSARFFDYSYKIMTRYLT